MHTRTPRPRLHARLYACIFAVICERFASARLFPLLIILLNNHHHKSARFGHTRLLTYCCESAVLAAEHLRARSGEFGWDRT